MLGLTEDSRTADFALVWFISHVNTHCIAVKWK